MAMPEYAFDLVVIGSGIAGQSAATAAAEAGLKVVLLEKTGSSAARSAMSGGFFAFSGTDEQAAEGIEDSAELFLQDMLTPAAASNDRAAPGPTWTTRTETYTWLKDQGADFRALEISSGQSAPRSHNSADHRTSWPPCTGTSPQRRRNPAGTPRRPAGARGRKGDRRRRRIRRRRGTVQRPRRECPGHRRIQPEHRSAADLRARKQLAAIPYGGKGNTGDGLRWRGNSAPAWRTWPMSPPPTAPTRRPARSSMSCSPPITWARSS